MLCKFAMHLQCRHLHCRFYISIAWPVAMASLPLNNKQLLDEAERDIKNYSDRGQCYLPKRS